MDKWHKVYRKIGELLSEYYLKNGDSTPELLYDKLLKGEFLKVAEWHISETSMSRQIGIDPIQIYASFSATSINHLGIIPFYINFI